MRKYLAVLLLLVSPLVQAQVHITQPFKFFWDEAAANVNGTAGQIQVQHFELRVDGGPQVNVVPLGGIIVNPGFVNFSLPADSALPLGAHTFTVSACSTSQSGVGCAASAPFSFVLDPNTPPASTNLGVGK